MLRAKEIGGFFELELPSHRAYHEQAVLLNSCRNGIRYLIRIYGITRLYIPAYTCPVVWQAIEAEECKIDFYEIDRDFMPVKFPPQNEWVLYTDYFGICKSQIEELSRRYDHLILDCSQSFYRKSPSIPCVYSPRKFFGVPDGGIVLAQGGIEHHKLERDVSLNRVGHLLQRIEFGPNAAYPLFCREDDTLIGEPIKRMSALTQRMLSGIEYDRIARIRRENFSRLHKHMMQSNELKIRITDDDVPMVYPYLIRENGAELKQRLIQNHIYIATYWRGQRDHGFGKVLETSMLALPIDQRYGPDDMDYMAAVIKKNCDGTV